MMNILVLGNLEFVEEKTRNEVQRSRFFTTDTKHRLEGKPFYSGAGLKRYHSFSEGSSQ